MSFGLVLFFFPSSLPTAPNSDSFVDWFIYYLETPHIFRLEHNTLAALFTICRAHIDGRQRWK